MGANTEMTQSIYKLDLIAEEQAQNESSDDNTASNDDDNVVDVDYEEVEEEKQASIKRPFAMLE